MRSFGQLWPTLKRLLAYGSPWRKQLAIAVVMLWVAAAQLLPAAFEPAWRKMGVTGFCAGVLMMILGIAALA